MTALPEAYKTTAVLFSTPEGREVAASLFARKSRVQALIVAPRELMAEEWVRLATRWCRGSMGYYLNDDTLRQPIEILALSDELYVIADESSSRSDSTRLQLPQGSEDLLWLAAEVGVEAAYLHVDGTQVANLQAFLDKGGAPERVAARKAQRAAFTRGLKEIRIYNDYSSSGLWEDGMLDYDQLDLPFPLVRRIARWQCDFDDTVTPPDRSSKEWWERHEQEEVEIAKAMQAALGPEIPVKVYRGGWLTVDQITRVEEGAP